jgi:hypothetical protein
MAVCDIYGICVLYVIEMGMDAYVWFVQVLARGAWMFAEMLINFYFGKLFPAIGKVMPNFSGDMTIIFSKIFSFAPYHAGNNGAPHERRYGG